MTTAWAYGHASSSRGPERSGRHFTLTNHVQQLHRALYACKCSACVTLAEPLLHKPTQQVAGGLLAYPLNERAAHGLRRARRGHPLV